jgi:tetratricopeptide (TPR) repeat protein
VLSLNPNHGGAKLGPGVVSLLQDDFGKAQKIFEEMNSRGNLIELHIAKGQIQKAIELQKDATKKAEIKSANNQRMHNLHQSSAQLHEAADKPDLALKEYQAAQTYLEKEASAAGRSDLYWYISAKRGNLSGQAFAYLEMGRLEKAEELLAEIENISPDIVEKKTRIMRSYHKGRIALEKNDTDTAILHMKNVLLWLDQECHLSRTSHAFHVNSMAEAYMKAGNLDEAISTYEKIPLLTTGRLNWGHVYAQSYYNLGKLYEQKGWKGKAIENYKRFVTLWKDADPQFQPLVEDAKKQLHNLEGN